MAGDAGTAGGAAATTNVGAMAGDVTGQTNIINQLYSQDPTFKANYDSLRQKYQSDVQALITQYQQSAAQSAAITGQTGGMQATTMGGQVGTTTAPPAPGTPGGTATV